MDTTQGDELIVLWFKVESAMAGHRKTRKIPRERVDAPARTAAMGAWWFAASWTAHNETDGFVPIEEFERWDPDGVLAPMLVDVGYLEDATVGGERGYLLHDWLDVQKSIADLAGERAYDARKAALHRDPRLTAAVRERDDGRCRYCAVLVNWQDRRSSIGATYDHVDPNGGNTFDNVVVACRGCNAVKAGRTPEEAGMPLLPAGTPGPDDGGPSRPPGGGDSPQVSPPQTNGAHRPTPRSSSEPDRTQISLVTDLPLEKNRAEQNREEKKTPRTRGPAAAPRTARETAGPEFEEWYAAYPRHIAPEAAARAFVKARRSVPHAELMTSTRRFAASQRGKDPKFVPHPATWLNAGRWADEPDRPARASFDRSTGRRTELA